MYLKSIQIENIGCIRHLNLEQLNPQMNVFTGPNGVGKTTVLKAVHSVLTTSYAVQIKKKAGTDQGVIRATLAIDDTLKSVEQVVKSFAPTETDGGAGFELGRKVIWIPDSRELEYTSLPYVPKDVIQEDTYYNFSSSTDTKAMVEGIKGWFVNRYLFSAHANGLSEIQRANLNVAIQSFSYLDPSVTFSRVDSHSLDILLNTPSGEVYFEYLSSGYNSLIIMILGIIKEIEFRYNDTLGTVADFDGVVIIDEIDLHLHPTWQVQIINALLAIFPHVQFFISTHSPHVVQSLSPNQLFPLGKEEEDMVLRQFPTSEYGFKGWTIEEILTEVMGMETIHTTSFQQLWSEFTKAIESDDAKQARDNGDKLLRMLHPSNVLRKVVELQLTSLGDD